MSSDAVYCCRLEILVTFYPLRTRCSSVIYRVARHTLSCVFGPKNFLPAQQTSWCPSTPLLLTTCTFDFTLFSTFNINVVFRPYRLPHALQLLSLFFSKEVAHPATIHKRNTPPLGDRAPTCTQAPQAKACTHSRQSQGSPLHGVSCCCRRRRHTASSSSLLSLSSHSLRRRRVGSCSGR